MTEQVVVPAFDTDDVQQARRTARQVRMSYEPVDKFIAELKDMQERSKDFLVPYSNLRVAVQSEETIDGEGVSDSYKLVLCLNDITIDGKKHDRIDVPFYEHVLGHISTHTGVDTAGVPIAYLRRLLANSKDSAFVHLAAANVNEWLSRRNNEMHTKGAKGVKCVLVRTFLEDDGRYYCRAIVSDRYFPLRTLDMVTIALGVVLGKTGDAEIDKTAAKNAWMFDQRISVEEVNVGFVNPRYAFDLRHPSEGIIQAERVTMSDEGIPTFHYPGGSAYTLGGKWTGSSSQQHLVLPACRISNSETGGGSAVIEPMMLEVACINGMTLMKAMRRNHLGSLMESADIYESDSTRKKKLEVVLSQMSDAMKQVFDLKQFEENNLAIALGLATGKIKSKDGGEETAIHGAYLFDKHLSVTGCTVGMVNPGFAFDLRHPSEGIIRAERITQGEGGQPVYHYPNGASYALGGRFTFPTDGPKQHLVLPAARISNSKTGGGSANIEMSFMEAVCLNTARMGQSITRRHLGGLMETADDYTSDETKKKVREAWLAMMADSMKQVFDEKKFEENCRAFLGVASIEIKDVTKVTEHLISAIRGADALLDEVLKAYSQFNAGKNTVMDVQSALTTAAQDQPFEKSRAA